MRTTEAVIGPNPKPIEDVSSVWVDFNPYGSKLKQRFRRIVKEAREQIPTKSRGVLIIQGLREEVARTILQERLVEPQYSNIVGVVAVRDGAIAVRRSNHADVSLDFLAVCARHSLFHGLDLGNQV